jgi:mono/diheme cytochrome c family protein
MKLILVAVACMLPILGAAAVPQAQTPATSPQTQTKAQAAPPTQTKAQTQTKAAAPAAAPKAILGANLVNPVKPTKASLAAGKLHYGWDCAMCHGDTGKGNGSLAASEKLSAKDFTNPAALQGLTDGQIFTVIRTGIGKKMPAESKARASDKVVWDLVNYLRSLSNPGATPAS